MPKPEKLLRTLFEAEKAFRDCPGRTGGVLNLPAGAEVLIAGDMHGNVDNFRRLYKRAALDKHPNRHLVLQEIIHGPNSYPEGGDKSHQLLDLVAALKCQYPTRCHFLLGNHELAQWKEQQVGKSATDLNEWFRQGVNMAYGPVAGQVYAAYVRLFASFSLAIRTANRVFLCHSVPSAKNLARFDIAHLQAEQIQSAHYALGGSVHSLLWGRDTRPANVEAFLKKVDADLVITGHVPCDTGYLVAGDRQLVLDCQKAPACVCLFPSDRPLTMPDLEKCVLKLTTNEDGQTKPANEVAETNKT